MRLSAIVGLIVIVLGTINYGVAVASSSQALGYEAKYHDNFSHFDYVNPDAPKGGELDLSSVGSFDSLNPFILKGISADGLSELMFETLMTPSMDEPFSQYGLLAEDSNLAEDGLSVTFRLNSRAKFSDGSSVTADDIKFSFDTLKSDMAHPQYRFYWSDITQAVIVNEQTVRFEFAKINPELHLIAGQIPVFSKKWGKGSPFNKLSQVTPLTSGPYKIESYNLGKQITYVRNADYWARDLPMRRGMYNFDRITYKYYRDATVALEAFKAGEFEFNNEYNSKKWATDYVGPRFNSGEIVTNTLAHKNNAGMQGFIFNIRKTIFKDQRVRRAITLAMDFEWSNSKLFYNQYERCDSYFSNSELASRGLPEGDELRLLEPFKTELPSAVFEREWQPPTTKRPASLRSNLREANRLFKAAGWRVKGGVLTNESGEPFHFEVILAQKGFERIMAPFERNLKKLGVDVEYRTVDVALYQQRLESFDFDMVVSSFGQSQSPGNELMGMFHSSAAHQNGSRNLIGIADPVVDALIDKVIYARDRKALVTAVHALDRVLLNADYLVPHWYIASHRIAYWDRFGLPRTLPLYYNADSWMLATWWKK